MQNKISHKKLLFIALLILIFYFPLKESFTSSWACGEESVFEQSTQWVEQNISDKNIIAFYPMVTFPSQFSDKTNLVAMSPNSLFSLEEVRGKKANYAFINIYNAEYKVLNTFVVNFFISPDDLYKNNYVALALYEYQNRGKLLKKIAKPDMCNQPTLIYYKLPSPLPPAKHLLKKLVFNNNRDLSFWTPQEFKDEPKNVQIAYSQKAGRGKSGALVYSWVKPPTYTLPRILSKKINAKGNTTYTFSGWIKSKTPLKEDERDGFLRIDFYKDKNPNISLPGASVALSPRYFGNDWKKIVVTTISPAGTKHITLSLQAIGTKQNNALYFDDFQIREQN